MTRLFSWRKYRNTIEKFYTRPQKLLSDPNQYDHSTYFSMIVAATVIGENQPLKAFAFVKFFTFLVILTSYQ